MAADVDVRFGIVALVTALSTMSVWAADAAAGRLIYQNGAGTAQGCAAGGCHGPSPLANQRNVLAAANDPQRITLAMLSDRGGMGVFLSFLSAGDIADVAAYIGAVEAGEPTSGVSPSPVALRFPPTLAGGRSAALTVLLTNVSLSPLTVGPVVFPNDAGFVPDDSAGACARVPQRLPVGAACALGVVHAPSRGGRQEALLDVAVEANGRTGTLVVPVSGDALLPGQVAPSLSLSAEAVHFGAVDAQAPAITQRLELVNPGERPLRLSAPQVTGVAFAVLPSARPEDCPTAGTRTLAAGERCSVGVRFAPPALGPHLGRLRLVAQTVDDATPVEVSAALDGVAEVRTAASDGGGGCTAVTHGRDPGLALLLVAAVVVALWRAKGRRA